MARYDDLSCDPSKWSPAKLVMERKHGMPAVVAEYEARYSTPPLRCRVGFHSEEVPMPDDDALFNECPTCGRKRSSVGTLM